MRFDIQTMVANKISSSGMIEDMNTTITKPAFLIAMLLAVSMAVSACGRRGGLEAPETASVITSDSNGEIVEEAPAQEDKPFLLDPLL